MAENSLSLKKLDRAVSSLVMGEAYLDIVPKYSSTYQLMGLIYSRLFEIGISGIDMFWDDTCWGVVINSMNPTGEEQFLVRKSGQTPMLALCEAAVDFCKRNK